ncbi:F0F1 ATP synthase subunit delta [Parolsenella sp.]|uniref:F0F1 ATP synthase subunit delta n=1 Tax=Parolsenella sp. TaxID=2083006 RepID=UPI0025F00C04|nr:F0F1 ATP synthase subunit delta [Parolsenella sp.]MEE1373133.1 F0F1 ATP synthase subunit delta [Parolsenella sp.]
MTATPNDNARSEKSEKYARALIEAARQEGRANKDLVQWKHAMKFSFEVLETLSAMRNEDDLDLISDVERAYNELLESEDETVSVTVTTAVPMDDDLRAKVRAKAEKELNAPIYLVERVEPSIIGGIILEAYGKRFDASVKAQLANIRKTLTSTSIGSDD